MKVWVGDALVDESVARVSPFDHGVTVGDGVFETLRTYGGRPFAPTRHHDRLVRSASALGLDAPDAATVASAVDAVLAANTDAGSGAGESRVRVTVTGGPAPPGSARGGGPPTLIVAATPLGPVAARGAVALAPWTRNEHGALAGLKTTSYGENVRALAWATAQGADEALLANTVGMLCEGTGTNVFLAFDGGLVTPTLSSGCLAGITRALVLEACAAAGVPVVEADVAATALADAREVFLTSSIREVQAVDRIDGRAVAGAPGPLTAAAAAAFHDLVARGLDP